MNAPSPARTTPAGTDGTWTVKKGGVENLQVRTTSRIVDKPGQTS